MEKVLIMMATYNGEKYIRKQLDSIIDQTYTNWNLIIQDDGSTDETMSIIQSYVKKDDRIILKENTNSEHGPYVNFYTLINYSQKLEGYDLYMFCDQDDIWLPNKIEHFLKNPNLHGKKPYLVYADMKLIDENDKETAPSLNDLWKTDGKNRYSIFFSTKVLGCNMIMNKSLFMLIPEIDINEKTKILAHDGLVLRLCAVHGKYEFDKTALMCYRRHGGNVTAEQQQYNATLKRVIKRICNLRDLSEKHSITYIRTLISIDYIRKTKLNEKQKKFLDSIEYAIKKGGVYALLFTIKHHIVWGKTIENTSRRLILLLGMYRKYL